MLSLIRKSRRLAGLSSEPVLRRSRRIAGLDPIVYEDVTVKKKVKANLMVREKLAEVVKEFRAKIAARSEQAALRYELRSRMLIPIPVTVHPFDRAMVPFDRAMPAPIVPVPVAQNMFNWRYLLCCWIWILLHFKW